MAMDDFSNELLGRLSPSNPSSPTASGGKALSYPGRLGAALAESGIRPLASGEASSLSPIAKKAFGFASSAAKSNVARSLPVVGPLITGAYDAYQNSDAAPEQHLGQAIKTWSQVLGGEAGRIGGTAAAGPLGGLAAAGTGAMYAPKLLGVENPYEAKMQTEYVRPSGSNGPADASPEAYKAWEAARKAALPQPAPQQAPVLGQPLVPQSQAPSAPVATGGVGIDGKPLQGVAAAAFQGYQPNGTPIFGGDSKSLAGVQPASGHFNQAAADQHNAAMARISAQADASRLARLQSEMAMSHNPAVVQAAAGMSSAVVAANDKYNELLQASQGGAMAGLTPAMKQQLAFEQARMPGQIAMEKQRVALQNDTPQGRLASMQLDKMVKIEALVKSLAEEKDPKKKIDIANQISVLTGKKSLNQPAQTHLVDDPVSGTKKMVYVRYDENGNPYQLPVPEGYTQNPLQGLTVRRDQGK